MGYSVTSTTVHQSNLYIIEHTYFKHIKIALFRFSDILPKPDVQQNFASELSQNLVRTWSELGNAAEHSRTYHALS